ncbi:formate dehydrogenase accessory sulfurtransferase FdhD [Marinomonas sp. THO17]|uniref:formate dehydrogenase accessory sulfurtransferase FdhD n=1 Tax=Marinomonas sp. THO17 TaxID=3149048 RepID=UPI00336BB8EA
MPLNAANYQGFQTTAYSLAGDVNDTAYTDLVEEVPVTLSIHDLAHAVVMVTPIQLEEFAIGFAISEGIIDKHQDLRDIVFQEQNTTSGVKGLEINLQISPRRFHDYKQTRKVHVGASGCGLCGKESLQQAFPDLIKLPQTRVMDFSFLEGLRDKVFQAQRLGKRTGALHAALLLDPQGNPLCCMEDIGRHNCLDKIIGYAAKTTTNLDQHSVVMSSRCSTELILKAVKAKLSNLIHLASPSQLAVNLAQEYGLTLIHLPKHDAPRFFAKGNIKDRLDDK